MNRYVILGAGPAGLQLAYFLRRTNVDVVVLEAGPAPGMFFRTFPRHRTLISINKVHNESTDAERNLRADWNSLLDDEPSARFGAYTKKYFPSADDYVRYLTDFAERHAIPIHYDTRIDWVRRDGDGFVLTDQQGVEHAATRVIVATGVSKPVIPSVPGIEAAEFYTDVSVNPDDFAGQRVLILGKGNSAFETADNLIATASVIHVAGPSSLRLAWRTHYVGHLRAVNNNFLDTYQLKSDNAILDGDVVAIEKRDGQYRVTFSFSRANEVKKSLTYDRVIVCTGFRFDASIFDHDCRPELVHRDRFPKQTSAFESTNVPGMYFAGTLMQVRDFKKSTSGFVHGFRYAVGALAKILLERHEGRAWPTDALPLDPRALADAVLARVNRSSALWQQFGVLADVIEIDPRRHARYREEEPLDHAREGRHEATGTWFSITLEYGPDHDKHDPFDIAIGRAVQNDASRAHEGQYLHPVVREHRRGKVVSTHHVAENLENDWTGETSHHEPLRAYFARALARSVEMQPDPVARTDSASA
jgi:cation diffusion facilitator CzcD-associated flavoprotein CzcO